MIAFLQTPVLGVPVWALAIAANLAAALACVCALFIETKPMAFGRHALLVGALVVLAGLFGVVIALIYALVFYSESRLWRAHVHPPARRVH